MWLGLAGNDLESRAGLGLGQGRKKMFSGIEHLRCAHELRQAYPGLEDGVRGVVLRVGGGESHQCRCL